MDNETIRFIVSFTLNALIILAGIYLIFVMGNKAYSFGHNIFNEESVTSQADARQVEITLTGFEKSGDIAKILYDKGLVKDETIAHLQIVLSDYKGDFKAGTYQLDTSMKPTEMFEIMSKEQE